MTQTQHTPAPWYAKPDDMQGFIYQEKTGKNVAVCYSSRDAYLIAAAPELLEALEGLLKAVDTDPDEEVEPDSPYGNAIAAINKAKGGV